MSRAPARSCSRRAWPAGAVRARPRSARRCDTGTTFVTDDAEALIARPARSRWSIEATGDPGDRHPAAARAAIAHGKHIVMVNVEADALAGPLLARKARGGRRRLLAGLGRPAGADLRARRLGARLRLQGGRGRQGHALPPELSPIHARHGVGHPRRNTCAIKDRSHDQSEDVQLASSTAPSRASR